MRYPVHIFATKQVGCRGDSDLGGVGDRAQTLTMAIEVDPLALPRRATIETVVKGGSLEAPRVLRKSTPISTTIWPVVPGGGGDGLGSGGGSGHGAAAED